MRIFAWLSALLLFLITTITAYLFVPLSGPRSSEGVAPEHANPETVERAVTDTFESLRIAVTERCEEMEIALRELEVESLLPRVLDLEHHSPPRSVPETGSSLEAFRSAAGFDLLALASLRGDVVVSTAPAEKGEEGKHLREVVGELARSLPPDSEVSSGIEALPLPRESNKEAARRTGMFLTALRPLRARPDVVSGVLVAARRFSGTTESIVRTTDLRWHIASVGDGVVVEGDLVGRELRRPLVIELQRGLRSSRAAFDDEGPYQVGLWGPLVSTKGGIAGAVGVTAPPEMAVFFAETASRPPLAEGLRPSRLFDLACLIASGLAAVFILAALVSRRAE